ncbi:hsp70 nucleotide exchange factor fes1 [Dinochytrium kinnereticum]|nr:hsp70 nucleotide exchange factor fes1 [Dinochytrium kinnereticum]
MSRPITQAELLQWAVINQTTAEEDAPHETPKDVKPLDPKWVDVILGKPDSLRMRGDYQDKEKNIDERLDAFDELEMLVESIDNANDLRPLGLWKHILSVLQDEPEAKLRAMAAWVASTAVQNNERAQKDLMDVHGIEVLIQSLETEVDADVKAKVITCISGLIRHNHSALEIIRGQSGLRAMVAMLTLPSPEVKLSPDDGDTAESNNMRNHRVKKRILFLLQSLLDTEEDSSILQSMLDEADKDGWAASAAICLEKDGNGDVDFLEKSLSLILALAERRPSILAPALKLQLQSFVSNLPIFLSSGESEGMSSIDEEILQRARVAFSV